MSEGGESSGRERGRIGAGPLAETGLSESRGAFSWQMVGSRRATYLVVPHMATTIAHTLSGVLCLAGLNAVRAGAAPGAWRAPNLSLATVLIAAVAANTPDLDLLVSVLLTGSGGALHAGPTHSLAFAVLAGIAATLAVQDPAHRPGIGYLVLLAVASHSAVDFVTGQHPGHHPSYGLNLFWPFTSEIIHAPVTLLRGVEHGSIPVLLCTRNLYTACLELVIFLPLAALSVWASERMPRASRASRDTRPGKPV